MNLVPPAGVEPTTYRLGGGSSDAQERIDLQWYLSMARPIILRMHTVPNPLIWQDAIADFGRSFPLNGAEHVP